MYSVPPDQGHRYPYGTYGGPPQPNQHHPQQYPAQPVPDSQQYSYNNMAYGMRPSGMLPNGMPANGFHGMMAPPPPASDRFVPTIANIQGVPPSPSQLSNAPDDMTNYELPEIPDTRRAWRNHAYYLQIPQDPVRARMCGFGDKDRRPITPPLIIRCVIIDMNTGQEIDYNHDYDYQKLVLGVDLWNVHGTDEENTVKHNSNTPSISSSDLGGYGMQMHVARAQEATRPYAEALPQYTQNYPKSVPSLLPTSPYEEGSLDGQVNGTGNASSPAQARPRQRENDGTSSGPEPSKNLIGTTFNNVQRLQGVDGVKGLFFVFQDLSVRTEGWFRLKCSLFALGLLGFDNEKQSAELLPDGPNLASCFTKPFKVFSAKRFPGVIATTELSQHFAQQGIKIPIRNNESKGKKKRSAEEEADQEEQEDDEELE